MITHTQVPSLIYPVFLLFSTHSRGLRAMEYAGTFTMRNMTDVEFGGIDEDKCITVRIKHEDKIPEGMVVYELLCINQDRVHVL